MDYEVEIKFRRQAADGLEARLAHLGGEPGTEMLQQDTYFAHPVRNFARTDEAFRIRSVGDKNRLTYKGPRIDSQSKTRQEVEVSLAAGAAARRQMTEMLLALGFKIVLTVVKARRHWEIEWEQRSIHVALDTVEDVGEFAELEVLAAESDWQAARDSLLRLARDLRLNDFERRSYLELVLAAKGQSPDDEEPAC